MGSPYHTWVRKFTQRGIEAELGSLVKGRLKRVVVLKQGVSPRIVRARIVGTGGNTITTGPTLKARLGLPDTWARFTSPRQARMRRAAFVAAAAPGW